MKFPGRRMSLGNDPKGFKPMKMNPSVPPEHPNSLSHQTYGRGDHPQRAHVDPSQVSWKASFPDYQPVEYTAKVVIAFDRNKRAGGWADPEDFMSMRKEWLQRQTQCASNIAQLAFPRGLPRNPVGRTGMSGRGLLGKWGPNQAADPIVTCLSPVTGKLYMVAIKRQDTGTWAIPGGMVDDGEYVTKTLMREFEEEAAEESVDMKKVLAEIFHPDRRRVIFRGYVDDPRNTDNAWMETTVIHCHCTPHLAERLRLHAGDDAASAAWICVEDNNSRFTNLYASHKAFVEAAVARFKQEEEFKRIEKLRIKLKTAKKANKAANKPKDSRKSK